MERRRNRRRRQSRLRPHRQRTVRQGEKWNQAAAWTFPGRSCTGRAGSPFSEKICAPCGARQEEKNIKLSLASGDSRIGDLRLQDSPAGERHRPGGREQAVIEIVVVDGGGYPGSSRSLAPDGKRDRGFPRRG